MKNYLLAQCVIALFLTCSGAFVAPAHAAPGFQVCDNASPPACAPVDATNGLKVQSSGGSLPTGASTSALQTSVGATAHTDAIAPTPLPPGYSFSHISTATTTTVKSGAGVIHTLTVNNLGTVASVTTVYDNTAGSGTAIAVINTLAGQESYVYDIAFATGLTLVTTGTVAPDITVSYR